jgi:hypothetical protein
MSSKIKFKKKGGGGCCLWALPLCVRRASQTTTTAVASYKWWGRCVGSTFILFFISSFFFVCVGVVMFHSSWRLLFRRGFVSVVFHYTWSSWQRRPRLLKYYSLSLPFSARVCVSWLVKRQRGEKKKTTTKMCWDTSGRKIKNKKKAIRFWCRNYIIRRVVFAYGKLATSFVCFYIYI